MPKKNILRPPSHATSKPGAHPALPDSARREKDILLKISSRLPGMVYQYRLRPDGTSCFPYVSTKIREMLRVTPEEVSNDASKVFTYIHPEDLERVVSTIQKSAQDLTPWMYEYRVRFPDGAVRSLCSNAIPEPQQDGSVLWHGFTADITEHNTLVEVLSESEDRFAQLAEQSKTFVWEVDADGLYTHASKVVESVLGYRPDELVGRLHFYDLHPEEGRQEFKNSIFQALGTKETFKDFENVAQAKDGRLVYLSTHAFPLLNTDGSLRGYRGSDTDISARKRTEKELRQLADRLLLATKAGGVGIWDWDIIRNHLVWDEQMYRLYGLPQGPFAEPYELWTSGVHPEDRERTAGEIQMALRGEKDFDTDFRVLWPDGNVRHIRAMSLVQRNAVGEPLHMIGTNWDITDQKLAAEAVLSSVARTEEFAKNKARFVSMASHELRTPLANMMLSCDLLKNFGHALTPEQSKQTLESLVNGVSTITQTLDDLLFTGKIEEGKLPFNPTFFPLLPFLQRCCLDFQDLNESPSRLLVTFQDIKKHILADENILRRILKNLLENALKYSPPEAPVEVGVDFHDGFLSLSVRDRGIGIPETEKKFLFEAFSRASNVGNKPGSGLGLYIAQKCAQAHGGRMQYTPRTPGSEFSIIIPLQPQPTATNSQSNK